MLDDDDGEPEHMFEKIPSNYFDDLIDSILRRTAYKTERNERASIPALAEKDTDFQLTGGIRRAHFPYGVKATSSVFVQAMVAQVF